MLGSDSGESALSAKPKPAERPVSLPTRQRHACDPYLWLRSVVRPYRALTQVYCNTFQNEVCATREVVNSAQHATVEPLRRRSLLRPPARRLGLSS